MSDATSAGVLPSARPKPTIPSLPPPATTVRPVPSVRPTVTVEARKPTAAMANEPKPKTAPTKIDTATSDEAGPAVAGPCSGVTVKPGQNPQTIVNRYPAGTTFCFAKGLHRITQTLRPKADQTLASDEQAVLTGSVPLTKWTRTGTVWVTNGVLPAAYSGGGECEDNRANLCRLREQLFLDGAHLKRVGSVLAVKAGTFFADYQANAVYLGSDPAGASVEMSRTATAIESNQTGVEIRGLTVEHFASAAQAGAIAAGPRWTVRANDIRWNHGVGLMLVKSTKSTVERNLIRNNGQLGLGQYASTGASIVRNVVTGNNTDGFWIADWESGGIKSTRSSGTVQGNLIKDNRGVGMWADVADDGRQIIGNRIVGNAADGIRFEISRNGVIEDNTITGNGFGTGRGSGTSLWDGGGINVNTSSNVRVSGNTVTGNINGITVQSRTRGSGPWGTYVLRDVSVSRNTVEMAKGEQSTGIVHNSGAPIPAGELVFSANRYVLDRLASERFSRSGDRMTAAEWRRAGHDTGGTFVAQ